MASWNYSTVKKTDPNPPHLTNLDDGCGDGEYCDSGRIPTGIPLWPDAFMAFGCLAMMLIAITVIVVIPLLLILNG